MLFNSSLIEFIMALTLVIQVTFFLHLIKILRHDFKQYTTYDRKKPDLHVFN